MNPARRLELALRALALAFAVVGGAALFLPAGATEEATPPAGLDEVAFSTIVSPPPGSADDGQTVIDGNIFSPRRARPAVRYDPYAPVQGTPSVNPVIDVPETMGDPSRAVPRLFGTMVGPGGATALLRLDPSVAEARLYREGERGGAYRVVKIMDQSVELSGPSGSVVLRLPPPPGGS